MLPSDYHRNISGYPPATSRQSSPPPPFLLPEADVPRQVPLRGEYSGYDAFQGGATYPRTGASHEGEYSQVPLFRLRLGPDTWDGASVGQPAVGVQPTEPSPSYIFGPAHHQYPDPMIARGLQGGATYPRTRASNEGASSQVHLLPGLRPDPWASASVGQPAMDPLPAFGPGYPAQPANARGPPHSPAYQQSPNPMIASRSQYGGPQAAVVRDALGGPYYHPWTSSQPSLLSPPSTGSFPPGSPISPQGLDVTNEHDLLLPIIVPQPPSQCRGRRRALIIGINYTLHSNSDFRLRQGVEDAYGMANFLRDDLGFANEDVRIMADESSPWDSPTKDNIIEAMRMLVRDAQPNDSLFLYYSGHAKQIKDLNGDESSGFDQCICAVDYLGDEEHSTPDTPGLIVDDLMHEILVKPLPSRCRLTAIFDACHSGTLLDLHYIYDSNGVVKRFKLPHHFRISCIIKRIIKRIIKGKKSSGPDVISLGASKDRQTSLETAKGGALRQAFIGCMRASRNNITYKELIQTLREDMKRQGLEQQPQLSSAHKIDTSDNFII